MKKDREILQGVCRFYNHDFMAEQPGLKEADILREIPANFHIIYGMYGLGGRCAYNLARYSDFYGSMRNLSNNNDHPILDLLNAKYVLTKERLGHSGLRMVYAKKGAYVYENSNVLPKAFLVHEAKVLPSIAGVLKELNAGGFMAKTRVLLEEAPPAEIYESDLPESVRIEQYLPTGISIKVKAASPGFLIISENWYPSWQASINGKPAKIYKAYLTLMAIYVEKGEHLVRFSHRSSSLRAGTVITIATIGFLIATIFLAVRRKKGNNDSSAKGA
ncbi:MAG: YfhO family protein [Candidatus Margulisbacteria bacterium]|nr:YfhO family protein [Candidatus Margulisiibacteriota bacterium]